jgi:hypothetical protein
MRNEHTGPLRKDLTFCKQNGLGCIGKWPSRTTAKVSKTSPLSIFAGPDVFCQEKLSTHRQGHQLRCAKNRPHSTTALF